MTPREGSGYKTVTVPTKLYKALDDRIRSLQTGKMTIEGHGLNGEKLDSMGKFIGFLFEQFLDSYNLSVILKRFGLQGGTLDFSWPSRAFTELCSQMNWYRSTEWIRSENHAATIGEYQWPLTLKERIKTYEQFKFEKILIISEDLWESPETWRWVWKVFSIANDNPSREITTHVTKEKKAKGASIDPGYFDMGIYKVGDQNPFIGFLDHRRNPPEYKWRLEDDSCKGAEKAFAELMGLAESDESIGKMFARHFNPPKKIDPHKDSQ